MPNPVFSNHEYYHNVVFKKLLVEHSKILTPETFEFIEKTEKDPEEFIEQLFENYYHNLYRESIFWFNIFKDADWWREGLE